MATPNQRRRLSSSRDIPCEVNIFVDEQTKQPLAINQIVALVCKIAADQPENETETAK
jgi:hypothetical protein